MAVILDAGTLTFVWHYNYLLYPSYLLLNSISLMSNDSEERNLEQAQRKQNNVGEAASDPETTGPAENLREKAAEMNDSKEDKSEEPA